MSQILEVPAWGGVMTKKEEQEASVFIAKYKAGKLAMQSKRCLQKTIS